MELLLTPWAIWLAQNWHKNESAEAGPALHLIRGGAQRPLIAARHRHFQYNNCQSFAEAGEGIDTLRLSKYANWLARPAAEIISLFVQTRPGSP